MRIGTGAFLCAAGVCAATAHAAMLDGRPPEGFQDAFGLKPDQLSKTYSVQQVSCSAPANAFWPGEAAAFTLQFVNKTGEPLRAAGQAEVITYATASDAEDVFRQRISRLAQAGVVPLQVEIPPNGFADVTVRPPIPERFGAYVVVVELAGHGRQFAAACVRVPVATPGRVQFPAYALDMAHNRSAETMALFKRLGIKGCRMEWGHCPTTERGFYEQFARLAGEMRLLQENNITLMLTLGASQAPQPLGRPRPHLDDQGVMLDTKSDMAWLPAYDEDFQKWVKIACATFGWPRGPLNAVELWNEPWEGLSISGWGADLPRYRELYARMAQGVEEARKEAGVKVLIGGACSSMNTFDKLFADGTDTYLKWLDFVSIHYQPMGAVPALVPEWANRKSPFGPVRVWDTESWIANSEDRVAAVIASMRAQGQSRTAGVLHDSAFETRRFKLRVEGGTVDHAVVQTWAPAAAIAATQKFIGERPFKELLFKNGLPWVFVFDAPPGGKADDATVVVVGDLGGVYQRDLLLFRSVYGLKNLDPVAEARKKRDALPANASQAERRKIENELHAATVLEGGAMALADGGGAFALHDFYGNRLPSQDGRIAVPLNGLGYFLRADGSEGSFARLIEALRSARIEGYEPLDVVARDMTAPLDKQPALRLSLTNVLNRPVAGEIHLRASGLEFDPKTLPKAVEFQAHETKEIVLTVSGGKPRADNTYRLEVEFDAGKDGKAFHEEDLHVNVIAKRTITVDGDLKDWEGVLPQPVHASGRKVNLTEKAWFPFEKFDETLKQGFATGYVAYDESGFYFAARIADDTPYDGNVRFAARDDDQYYYPEVCYEKVKDAKAPGGTRLRELKWPEGVRRFSYRRWPDLPSGAGTDNVQIAFNVLPLGQDGWLTHPPGTMPRFMQYRCSDYEYAFTQVAEKHGGGTEIWRLFAPGMVRKHFYPRQPKAARDGGAVENGKLALKREGNMRVVEAFLPWAEIPDVKKKVDAGEPVKFSFRANDNKGPGVELAEGRSVSKINNSSFHDDWSTSWANELEFGVEK